MEIIDCFDVHEINNKKYLYDYSKHHHINKNVIICDVDVSKFNKGFDYDGDIYYYEGD